MKFTGITVMRLDTPNKNNRVYPTEVMQEALDAYKKQIEEKRALGVVAEYETDSNWATVDLTKASHIVEKLEIANGELLADIRVLDTPAGEALLKLMNEGVVALRPRGLGQIRSEGDAYIVSEYELVSIDAIAANNAA